jgi:hypothetical protein
MAKTDAIVLAEDAAPYTDPGVTGQPNLKNEAKQTMAPDDVKPGTPPGNGSGLMHSGNANISQFPGERAASLFDREQAIEMERASRHTETAEGTAAEA